MLFLSFFITFSSRGPTHSLRHLTSPQGLIRLLPGGRALTRSPPEFLMSSSEQHFSWWSTLVT